MAANDEIWRYTKPDKFRKAVHGVGPENDRAAPRYRARAIRSRRSSQCETVHHRANAIDDRISLATVYRTLRLFEEIDILDRHDFGDGRARYEQADQDHHDHLIDVKSGKVIEFQNREIEQLQSAVAERLGYKLVGHKLELYAVRVGEDTADKDG